MNMTHHAGGPLDTYGGSETWRSQNIYSAGILLGKNKVTVEPAWFFMYSVFSLARLWLVGTAWWAICKLRALNPAPDRGVAFLRTVSKTTVCFGQLRRSWQFLVLCGPAAVLNSRLRSMVHRRT